jgi:hypothetical protein
MKNFKTLSLFILLLSSSLFPYDIVITRKKQKNMPAKASFVEFKKFIIGKLIIAQASRFKYLSKTGEIVDIFAGNITKLPCMADTDTNHGQLSYNEAEKLFDDLEEEFDNCDNIRTLHKDKHFIYTTKTVGIYEN